MKKKESARLKEERDILKKAAAYLLGWACHAKPSGILRSPRTPSITDPLHRIDSTGRLILGSLTNNSVGDITYIPTQEGWLYLVVWRGSEREQERKLLG